jgi:hypothetical protein
VHYQFYIITPDVGIDNDVVVATWHVGVDLV